jgi:hypothetical protein
LLGHFDSGLLDTAIVQRLGVHALDFRKDRSVVGFLRIDFVVAEDGEALLHGLRLVDAEGMQACELVAADVTGVIDPAILGARGDSDASGLKQILSGTSESARSVRDGLERRGIGLARARAVTLFGGESRPGESAEFAVTRDGLLIVAAPGAAMEAGAQNTATPIRLHVFRSRLRSASETHLPEPLADPLQDIRVNHSTAEAYVVRAGEYIQIIDVAGAQAVAHGDTIEQMILLHPAPDLILERIQLLGFGGPCRRHRRAAHVLAHGITRQAELPSNRMQGQPLRRQFVNGMHRPTPKHWAPHRS